MTFLVVLPYRNPFVTAKAAATLDLLSDGRLVLGVGSGYMREEFEALGVQFEERNDLVDEAIDAMKLAWSGEPVIHRGRHFTARGNVALPVPVQRPHPPIWVGGNSKRAIHRAVERGDGWMPLAASAERAAVVRTAPMNDLDDLERALDVARAHAAAIGRTAPLDVAFMPLGRETYTSVAEPASVVEAAGALASLGVTYLTMQFPVATRVELLACIERFGAEAVPPIAGIAPTAII